MGLKEVWSGWVSVPVPTGGGRRASFTDVNSCAHYIVCPENLVGQRKILDTVSVKKVHRATTFFYQRRFKSFKITFKDLLQVISVETCVISLK